MSDDQRKSGDSSGDIGHRKRDGLATIRLRHNRRVRAITRAGAIAIIATTVVVGFYVAYFV